MKRIIVAAVALGLIAAAPQPAFRIGVIQPAAGPCAVPSAFSTAGERAYFDLLSKRLEREVQACPVATFAERRLAVFESWGLTRGQFWRLFGAYVLALACVVVVGFLALVVFTGAAGVVVLLTGGQISDLGSILNPKDVTLRSYLSIGLIASMILSSVFSALWNAVMAAPGAVAYQQLHGDPPARPLSVQPEAG